jgi:hypothetical protein
LSKSGHEAREIRELAPSDDDDYRIDRRSSIETFEGILNYGFPENFEELFGTFRAKPVSRASGDDYRCVHRRD